MEEEDGCLLINDTSKYGPNAVRVRQGYKLFFFEKKKIELATVSNCLKFIDFYALKTTGAALLEI